MFDLSASWADGGLLGYLAVALAAAIPWLEILLVIPAAIGLGLEPFAVGGVAFIGNYLPVAGIVVAYERIGARVRREQEEGRPPGRRHERGRRVLARYGVPGLALIGPLVTGIHVATLLSLATGASRTRILAWTGFSLLAWTVALTIATVLGLDLVRR